MPKRILAISASGYIGSHTCVELLRAGFNVVALDNLCNSSREPIARVERINGCSAPWIQADVRDRMAPDALLAAHTIDAVIHFAGLKAAGESIAQPLTHYQNNVAGILTLLQALSDANIKNFIFSSSATVYRDLESAPIPESARLSATNPYGRSKLVVKEVLADLMQSDAAWCIAILRYFNPVGAHASGLIGEDPRGIPNSLMPFIAQVAVGRHAQLTVFGENYPTLDGTGVRDYIHVVDLARGPLAALTRLFEQHTGGFTVNLGTGEDLSVMETVRAFVAASGCAIPYRMTARRDGDIAVCYADPSKAHALLNWNAEKSGGHVRGSLVPAKHEPQWIPSQKKLNKSPSISG